MMVVSLKFADVAARSGFVIIATYSLSLADAGRFGFFVTILGIFSFAIGYERYIDLQRKGVSTSNDNFDYNAFQTIRFFLSNYIIVAPVFGVLLLISNFELSVVICGIFIALVETFLNFSYHMAIISKRYIPLMLVSVVRNLVLLLAIVFFTFWEPNSTGFRELVFIWAIISAGAICLSLAYWARYMLPNVLRLAAKNAPKTSIRDHYLISWHHFVIGLIAIITLQADRLIAGAILSAEASGIYFRHIIIISLIYQAFNIFSYNRTAPKIYAMSENHGNSEIEKRISDEYILIMIMLMIMSVSIITMFYCFRDISADYQINVFFALGLVLVSAIRMRADLNNLLFNSRRKENITVRLQGIAFVVGLILMPSLAIYLGIPGIIIASVAVALVYLLLSSRAVNNLEKV
ncbi:hypothetical protein [Maritalea sp. S77]|uniref:hypothetical protein n=1 Tax=Maritalea sp. S77 TaxID=3415125 RepID=UPI003C7D83E7